jgi:hypothetical protein
VVCKCQPPSYVEGLAQRVHPMDGHGKLFAMLQAYLDESGIDHKTPFAVVAGYCGGTGQWKRFERKWKNIIDSYGVQEFHAKRFFGRDPQGNRLDEYIGWTDARAKVFVTELLNCIVSVKIHPFCCVVVKADWEKLTHGEKRYLTGAMFLDGKFKTTGCPSKPYFAAFGWCVYTACRMATADQKVHFAFDLNTDLKGYSKEYFKFLKNLSNLSWGPTLGEPSWPTSLEAVQLQAGDLLAYLMIQFCPSRLKDPKAKPGWMLVKAMERQSLDKATPWLGGEALELMLSECSRNEMRAITPPKQPVKVKHRHLNGLA